MNTQPSVPALITHANLKCKKYIHLCDEICLASFESWEFILQFYQVDWWNLMKQSVTVGAQLLWSGRYGCNNGRYGCTIVMSYIEINKAVSQWLLTFNLCVSVTWPLTCAFHIPCTHTPEIIDMHRDMCFNYTNCVLMHNPHLEVWLMGCAIWHDLCVGYCFCMSASLGCFCLWTCFLKHGLD